MFAVYGIWEDLAAWKILLCCVPMICLQLLDCSPNKKSRSINMSLQRLDLDPNSRKYVV